MLLNRVQVVVVGAGLAGLATALFAAANGADVLLVEKHPVASPIRGRPADTRAQASCWPRSA